MPRRCVVDDGFAELVRRQCGVASREQVLDAGLSPRAIEHRMSNGQWQQMLPSVYLTHSGGATELQRLWAALLYAGPHAAIDGVDACSSYGLRAIPPSEGRVHVVVPWGSEARSIRWLAVRRTTRPMATESRDGLRYLTVAQAVIAAARGMRRRSDVSALLSEAVQRRLTTYDALLEAHLDASPRNSRLTQIALGDVGAGTRSAPEAEFRQLVGRSRILPEPIYNCLLQLPDGRLVSPDALIKSAALVHETNGRSAHARADLFDDMQARHDVMTAAGLTVLHNTPRRLRAEPAAVLAELEACYLRLPHAGLPPGVTIVSMAA